ncbi:MAG TPA: autotransporter-associated beta strand repeat-containing protein [Chthoniobacterales bacterium]|jgi:autotransporter-associated beta strand protein
MNITIPTPVIAGLCILSSQLAFAGSATWDLNPTNNKWNTSANWTPDTVPNGPDDVATFGASQVTNPLIDTLTVEVKGLVFAPNAPAYSITVESTSPTNFNIDRDGIVNNSGVTQSFYSGEQGFIRLGGNAGAMTYFQTDGGGIYLENRASAESANFVINSGRNQGFMLFLGSSTAADSTITVNGISYVDFLSGKGGNATLNAVGGTIEFANDADAEHATASCSSGGYVVFRDSVSAGDGTFSGDGTNNTIEFIDSSTGGDGTFVINGATTPGGAGDKLTFDRGASVGNAILMANGGTNGGDGARIAFLGTSSGDNATVVLSGNAKLEVRPSEDMVLTLGSLAGDGSVFLARTLTVGSNNLSTVFSGVIQESNGGNTAGSLTKVGTGQLTLTGANAYTGGTVIDAGTVLVKNTSGSALGTGATAMDAGTLGGSGTVAGAVTVGTGSGAGAVLAPAIGSNVPATLTIQSSLTLQADATYECTAQARGQRVRADKVVAEGVTINGATFSFQPTITGTLQPGTVFTVIGNTSPNPINGTFSNLADGAIITVGSTHFQANYEGGGGGNDLTLTVVP